MSAARLRNLSVAALLERWIGTGIAQGEALAAGEVGAHNRLARALRAVEQELARRDALDGLLTQLDHVAPQVRLNAARALAARHPAAARRTLAALAAAAIVPQAAAAAMDLWMIDKRDP